jgi:2,4-dienoyl-CoA reductase-like NADH-dependent reductase (Old Yellow Enzyme family)
LSPAIFDVYRFIQKQIGGVKIIYMNNYPYLFSPLKVGNLTLRNRIEAAPTAPWIITPEGYFNHDTIAYFELKAAGGAAIVHIGECLVHSKTSIKFWPDTTRLDDPNSFAGLALAARAIKRYRAIPSIELQHPGKSGGYNPLTGRKDFRYGPSHEITADGSEILEMPE